MSVAKNVHGKEWVLGGMYIETGENKEGNII